MLVPLAFLLSRELVRARVTGRGRGRVWVGLGLGLGLASRSPTPNLHQGCSDTAALLVASMVLLDGACLVESRLLLTDSVLFFLPYISPISRL